MPEAKTLTAESMALILSLAVLMTVVFGLVSCGDNDLFFPGELAPTNSPEPTSTNTPDDN